MRLDRILFLDIETVPQYRNYGEMPERMRYFWARKARRILQKDIEDLTQEELQSSYFERAGIYAEYAKVVCISVGFFQVIEGNQVRFRSKSFSGHDEKTVLEDFSGLLDKHFNSVSRDALCGHNIKEFDVPFVCRRLMLHGLAFPDLLQIQGKKPWELNHLLDTMQMWKFGDYKNYTSLDLLAYLFEVPSPKDDIDGSLVGRVYWEENDLDRIVKYCEKDVLTTAKVWSRMAGVELDILDNG